MRLHPFKTMKVALAAVALVNEATGYPREGCETQSYCEIQQVFGILFIQADAVTESILGPATEVDFSEITPT